MSDSDAAITPIRSTWLRGRDLWLWTGVLALAAAARGYAQAASSLWSDEGNSWALIQRGYREIAAAAAADIHPPLYYWLLKLWSLPFGTSATAMRSLSALLGVLLVLLTMALAQRAAPPGPARRWMPILAGTVAALNPFQVYYSQEARMYMLLAVEAAALLLLLLAWVGAESRGARRGRLLAGYVIVASAGLWTHYSFPIVLAAAALGYLSHWLRRDARSWSALGAFAAANLAALLLFAPWLPTALRQVRSWPQGGEGVGLLEGLRLTLHTLLFGLMRPVPEPVWPWLAAAGVLPLLGAAALRRRRELWPVALLLAAPVLLMAALGLFSDAFLKFLLVASAPWCLLVAAAPEMAAKWPKGAGGLRLALGAGAVLLALLALPNYYTNAVARDNYQGIARALARSADPATSLVVLDAPGQADVWRYYDPGLPVLAIPDRRPPEAGAVAAALEEATQEAGSVYAIFWATDESDPEGLVERWLDAAFYKGLESWQGNLRFVAYSRPDAVTCRQSGLLLEGTIELASICQPRFPQEVRAGEPAMVSLVWSAAEPEARDLRVSVQVLDARRQVVAQHDGIPGGGARPAATWQPGEMVTDNHAVLIPPGTPPGSYALVAVVYDAATGTRLSGPQGDTLPLGDLVVLAGESDGLSALMPMQHVSGRSFGAVTLAGYDLHKKGYGHAPETPLAPGDLLHLTLYWRAGDGPLPPDLGFTLQLGGETLRAPLAGGAYPTGSWPPGALVRGEFDLPYDGTTRRATLSVDGTSIRLAPLP